MPTIVSSYSLQNLIQSLTFLLNLTKSLNDEITDLEKIKTQVRQEQKEAQKQGILVKKMTTYMSEDLNRLESVNQDQASNTSISKNIEKLTETEMGLKALTRKLSEYTKGEDEESLKETDASLSIELKQYESFLIDLTSNFNEKIPILEKIVNRLQAEKRESQQQKILLKEMVDLFNEEILELGNTFHELTKGNQSQK